MAFIAKNLTNITFSPQRVWRYETTDSLQDVIRQDYFTDNRLQVSDVIFISGALFGFLLSTVITEASGGVATARFITQTQSGGGSATAPSNTATPVVSGAPNVGQVLTATTGTWTGTAPITYGYQWLRNGSSISGATASSYTLVTADAGTAVTVRVTATNVAGSAASTSNSLAVPLPDLRAISVQNRLAFGTDSFTGNDSMAFRTPHLVAVDSADIVLSFLNWTVQNNQQNTGNPYTIADISIEAPNGTVVPVTFGGQRSKIIQNGDNDIQCDAITASAFGLSKISTGETFWVKGRISVTAGAKWPATYIIRTDVSGAQYHTYSSSTTTPSSTDSAGQYTFSGTAPTPLFNGFQPIMLGHPLADVPTYLCISDSTGFASNDNVAQGVLGRGPWQRAMHAVGAATSLRPNILAAQNGVSTTAYTGSNTKWQQYKQYCNRGHVMLGTNDAGTVVSGSGETLSSMQTRFGQVYAALKSGTITAITQSELATVTTSTDNFATTANQTVFTQWDTGGAADLINGWFASKVSDGTLAGVASRASLMDTTNPRKWAVNGTANRITNDGIHTYQDSGNGVGVETYAAAIRAGLGVS